MATKQDIETLRKEIEIVELRNENKRNENKEYEKKLIELLRKKQTARDEAPIKFYSESKSANDRQIDSNNRQIEEKEKQITKLTKKQGKITAPPICCIFRQIIY